MKKITESKGQEEKKIANRSTYYISWVLGYFQTFSIAKIEKRDQIKKWN